MCIFYIPDTVEIHVCVCSVSLMQDRSASICFLSQMLDRNIYCMLCLPDAGEIFKNSWVFWFQMLEDLGTTTELVDVGKQTLPDGQEIPLPPVLLGQLGTDPKKKTVCIYGHLDVQPAKKVSVLANQAT